MRASPPGRAGILVGAALAALALVAPFSTLDAATIRGGSDDDRIVGTAAADRLFGGAGDDELIGARGDDRVVGESGGDHLLGGPGDDRLLGGDDDDRLEGGQGADQLIGGDGNDRLHGGRGADRLVGSAGNDRIVARDGHPDVVVCGRGDDTVVADARDEIAPDCERVLPRDAAPEGTSRQRPYRFGSARSTADGWNLEVIRAMPDATSAVLAESDANISPPPGDVFAMVRVRAIRTAVAPAVFEADIRLRAVGPSSAVVYSSFEDSCGLIPDEVSDEEVAAGHAVEGHVCWSVPEDEAGFLVMVDSPLSEDQERYFALR